MAEPQPDRRTTGAERTDLLRLLADSVVDYAIVTLDVDGVVTTWNPGAERLVGYSAADIVGRHFSTFYPPEDVAAGKPAWELREAAAEGRFEDEGWRIRKDGTQFWVNTIITALHDDTGALRGFGKVTRDLSERREAELALRESEERFRLLVEHVVDYAIFMLEPDGIVASWNLGAQRLKGYRPDEICGQHFGVFYTDDDREAGKPERMLRAALAEGRVEDEGWRVRKDGSRFWANVVITALHGDDGTLRGFSKVTRDLTERKRTEDARRDFSAIVAHDVRSPMGIIAGLSDLLLADWDRLDDRQRRDYVERIDGTVRGLRRVVEDILDVSRLEAGELTFGSDRFDAGALARRVVAELTPVDRASPIVVRVDDGAPWAVGDERRTWQVLSNLVGNALRFAGDAPLALEVRPVDDGVRVAVCDAGPGIPADQREGIFDRFTVGRSGGTGLGLYIAKSFVEAQGGHIGVEPTPGGGATFWFTLPAA